MRRITSHYIFPGEGKPIKFGIITLVDGVIKEISHPQNGLEETASTEFYPGVIIPALVGISNTNDSTIWFPENDVAVENVLNSQQELPIFAVITPKNIEVLSDKALKALSSKDIMFALGGESQNQVHLFRVLEKFSNKMPQLPFEELVNIACSNGAAALQLKDKGTIAPCKKPGICHISGFDFTRMNIQPKSQINVLIN